MTIQANNIKKLLNISLLTIMVLLIGNSCSKDDAPDPGITSFPGVQVFEGGAIADYDLLKLDDGNFILTVTDNNLRSLEISKITPNGNLIWNKSIADTSIHYRHSSMLTYQGNIYIAAHTFSFYTGMRGDFALMKISHIGDLLWEKFYPEPDDQQMEQLVLTEDNNLMIIGRHDSANSIVNADLRLFKVDLDGNGIWRNTYNFNGVQLPFDAVATSNGGIITLGLSSAQAYNSQFAFYLAKYDQSGIYFWEKRQAYGALIHSSNIQKLIDGNLMAYGGQGSSNGTVSGLLLKVDDDGEIIWNKAYDLMNGFTAISAVSENIDGTYSAIARTKQKSSQGDIWSSLFLKVDSNGDLITWQELGNSQGVTGSISAQDANGNMVIINKKENKLYLIRMTEDGVIIHNQ